MKRFLLYALPVAVCCWVAQSCPAVCNPLDCRTPGFPVLHCLPEFAQTHARWINDTIQPSSVDPFSSCPQSSPASGFFLMSQFFTSGGQSIKASALALVLPVNIQGWFPLGLTSLISLLSKGLSRVLSSTTILKHQVFDAQLSLRLTLTSVHDYWKDHSFDYADLCRQSNVSAFQYAVEVCHRFPSKEQVSFNFMAAVTIHSDFGVQEYKI